MMVRADNALAALRILTPFQEVFIAFSAGLELCVSGKHGFSKSDWEF